MLELKTPLPILNTDIALSKSSVSVFFSFNFVAISFTILER